MIEESFTKYLIEHALTAPFIAGKINRIFPLLIPQHVVGDANRMPCIVYSRIGEARIATFCGTDKTVAGTFQFDTYALSYDTSRKLSEAVRKALVDYKGMMNGTDVKGIFLEAGLDLLDPDPGLFRRSRSYSIWYVED